MNIAARRAKREAKTRAAEAGVRRRRQSSPDVVLVYNYCYNYITSFAENLLCVLLSLCGGDCHKFFCDVLLLFISPVVMFLFM